MRIWMNKMQGKSGYISIETIIVWGLMMALGAYAWAKFYDLGEVTIDDAMRNVSTASNVNVPAN